MSHCHACDIVFHQVSRNFCFCLSHKSWPDFCIMDIFRTIFKKAKNRKGSIIAVAAGELIVQLQRFINTVLHYIGQDSFTTSCVDNYWQPCGNRPSSTGRNLLTSHGCQRVSDRPRAGTWNATRACLSSRYCTNNYEYYTVLLICIGLLAKYSTAKEHGDR